MASDDADPTPIANGRANGEPETNGHSGAGEDQQEAAEEEDSIWTLTDTTPRNPVKPPVIFEEAAAPALNTKPRVRRRYHEKVLPLDDIQYGAFVQVRSYLAFVLKMSKAYPFKQATEELLWEPTVSTSSSAQLSRILGIELTHKSDGFVQVVHKVPILPGKKKGDQTVDMAIFVGSLQHPSSNCRTHIAVMLSYKLDATGMDEFLPETACYGTDYMSTSGRSMVLVQVCGTEMEKLSFRALGVVPWDPAEKEGPVLAHHRLTVLCEGQGRDGLKLLVSGLKGYLAEFRKEKENEWTAVWLGSSAALHYRYDGSGKAHVYKAYDYRHEKELKKEEDKVLQKFARRNPNIALVRKFVDEEAKQFKPASSLRIVKTKFFKRDPHAKSWFAPVPAKNLAAIVRQLQTLHSQGYVHGDIRVYNLLLHRGCLSDFDLTRQAGDPYPPHLELLAMDGRRAREVEAAIAKHKVGELAMRKSHDLESMHFVLGLFQPVDEGRREEWIENVNKRPAENVFDFMGFLETFDGKVELTNETVLGLDCVLCTPPVANVAQQLGETKNLKLKKRAAPAAKPKTTMEVLADIGEPDASVEWAV